MATRWRFIRSYFIIARHRRANLHQNNQLYVMSSLKALRPTDSALPSRSSCCHGYTLEGMGGSFSRSGDYDDGSGGVVACHSFSPGPLLFCIWPTIFLRPLSPPPGRRVSGEKSAWQGWGGGAGRLHSCTPAPVSKVIFGCPLLLWVSRNRRMNQPMEEEKTSSSLFSYEEGEAVWLR